MHPQGHQSRVRRRQFAKSVAAVGTVGLFAGCVGDNEPPIDDDGTGMTDGDDGDTDEPERGGTFHIATDDAVDTLDVRMTDLTWVMEMAHYLYDGLYLREPDGSGVVPHLAADSVERVDNTTYTVPLREGVLFHDGEEFTAEDVVYTFEWVLDPENESLKRSNIEFIANIEASGEYEVTFHLHHPFAPFEDQLADMREGIVPKHVAEGMASEEFAEQPIGTGPFMFESQEAASEVRLAAFEDYFLGEPQLDGLVYRVIQEAEVAYVELATGGVQQSDVPEVLLEDAYDDDAVHVKEISQLNYMGCPINCTSEPFGDIRIREAIHHLVDYDDLVNAAVGELGERNWGFLPPEVNKAWGFPWEEWREEYYPPKDHDRALELFDEAGVELDFEVDILTATGQLRLGPAVVLQNELEEIGLEASVRQRDIGPYIQDLLQANFDIAVWGISGTADPDSIYWLFRDLATDPGGMPPGLAGAFPVGLAYTAYRDTDTDIEADLQRMDAAIRAGRSTLDRDERVEHYIEAAEVGQGVYHSIPMYSEIAAVGWRDEVQEYEPTQFGQQELSNPWQQAWIRG